jgi:hypothetical protein
MKVILAFFYCEIVSKRFILSSGLEEGSLQRSSEAELSRPIASVGDLYRGIVKGKYTSIMPCTGGG